MTVRIGFIGTGGIAAEHLSNLMQIPTAEIVGLCDLQTEYAERAKERLNGRLAEKIAAGTARRLDAPAFTDPVAMFAAVRPHAVYVCVPPFAHGEPEAAVIGAGLPLFVEKPVALDLALTHRIARDIARRKLVSAVGYQLRYSNTVQKARELLLGQQVGMVAAMRYGGVPGTPWWRVQAKSGGQLVEMATHQIDLLRYLVGEIETVYAAGATRFMADEMSDFDIFDVNCVTLRFASGAVGTFSNNCISGYGSPSEAQGVHIFCRQFTLSLARGLRVLRPGANEEFRSEGNPMMTEDSSFVKAVADQDPTPVLSPYTDAMQTLAVTLAAERSARTGEPVRPGDLLAAASPA